MTSREFIERQFGNADGNSRTLSSIYKDGNGQIYSYYHHYPLLFSVGGLTFRNVRGYSSTTGKHIGWAGGADIDVVLSGCNQYSWRNDENKNKVPFMLYEQANYTHDVATDREILRAILKDLEAMRVDCQQQMDAKKRKDTRVYEAFKIGRDEAVAAIARVKAAI